MSRDEIEPMVPMMPKEETPTTVTRADGGHRKRYDHAAVDAPIIPDLR